MDIIYLWRLDYKNTNKRFNILFILGSCMIYLFINSFFWKKFDWIKINLKF